MQNELDILIAAYKKSNAPYRECLIKLAIECAKRSESMGAHSSPPKSGIFGAVDDAISMNVLPSGVDSR